MNKFVYIIQEDDWENMHNKAVCSTLPAVERYLHNINPDLRCDDKTFTVNGSYIMYQAKDSISYFVERWMVEGDTHG